MDLWSRLDAVQAECDVLQHPFYQRWSAGELSREELAVYAGEYRHAVVGLAEGSRRAAALATGDERRELEEHAVEEEAHVGLWDRFADAVGGRADVAPAPETAACRAAWAGAPERSLTASLVALYAIESAQPAISATKLDGLRAHYGVTDGPATDYFVLHAERDHEHAASERALLEPRLADADADALIAEAEAVLRANWKLLDGVERCSGRR